MIQFIELVDGDIEIQSVNCFSLYKSTMTIKEALRTKKFLENSIRRAKKIKDLLK